MNKDISLYFLMEYGLSKKEIEDKLLGEIHYIDLFYPRKRFFESNLFCTAIHRKITNIITENDLRLSSIDIDSIFILIHFGVSQITINKYVNKSVKRISKIFEIGPEKSKNIINKTTNLEYEKLTKAIKKYKEWLISNKGVIIKVFILELISIKDCDNFFYKINKKLSNLEIELSDYNIALNLAELEKENIISIQNIKTQILSLTLKQVLLFNFKNGDVFKEKVNNKTFKEIGAELGKTRSRIQQQYSQVLEVLPELIEDKLFAPLFTKYEFSQEEFRFFIIEDSKVYFYLDSKFKKGERSVYDFTREFKIPEEKVKEYLKSRNVFINHKKEMLPINQRNIFDEFIIINIGKIFDYETCRKEYNLFAKNFGLEIYTLDDIRAFEGIVENSRKIIRSNNRIFRGYDFDRIDETEKELLVNAFDIPDGIYGANKIFENNIELMEMLGLKDGYELFDLIKTLNIKIPTLKKVVRRTEAYIKTDSKYDFIKEILLNLNARKSYKNQSF